MADDVLSKLRSMRLSMWWYESCLKDLRSELRLICPPPYKASGTSVKTLIKRKKTAWFYTRMLYQECRSSISLLDFTLDAISEASHLIRCRLRLGPQEEERERFQATCIPNEPGLPEALRTASQRLKIPINNLRSYLPSLKSAEGYPSGDETDNAIQDALREVDNLYAAIITKCDMLKMLFDFKARYFVRVVRDRSTRRDGVLMKGRRIFKRG